MLRSPDRRIVTAVWIGWLVATLTLVAVSGAVELPPLHPHMQSLQRGHGPLWLLEGWDFRWYRGIATIGYGFEGIASYAFFPLWPALLRLVGSGYVTLFALVVAVAMSGAAFTAVAASHPRGAARRTAFALAALPGSFALVLPYADGIALAAAAGAYVSARHARWLPATILGFAAATARPSAFLLSILLAGVCVGGRGLLRWAAAAAPVAGFLVVNTAFWIVSGDAFAFLHAERHWGRGSPLNLGWPSDPWAGLQPIVAVASIVFLVVLWRARRRYGTTPSLFAASVIALSLLSGTFAAFSRQMMLAFPLTWVAADIRRRTYAQLAAAAGIAAGVANVLFLPHVFP
jgi:hypothetical protein